MESVKLMSERLYWHGTNRKNASAILKSGYFQKDTWFANHMEDAISFGGQYVFTIVLEMEKHNRWQVCLSRPLSIDNMLSLDKIAITNLRKNKQQIKDFFRSEDVNDVYFRADP